MSRPYPTSFTEAYTMFRQAHPDCNEVINVRIDDGPFWPQEPQWKLSYIMDNEPPLVEGVATEKGRRYAASLQSADERRRAFACSDIKNKIHALIIDMYSSRDVEESAKEAVRRIRQLVEGMGDQGIRARLETLPGGQQSYRWDKSTAAYLSSVSEEYKELGISKVFLLPAIHAVIKSKRATVDVKLARDFFEKLLEDVDAGRLHGIAHCEFRADNWVDIKAGNGKLVIVDMDDIGLNVLYENPFPE